MATEGTSFEGWLKAAGLSPGRLSEQQIAVLQSAFCFLQECGGDFASQRILTHFLLHCRSGLKIAQIGRLVGLSRQVTSRHQKLSSRQVVQEVHHRFSGRPYGKLLPRYAGSIAQFLVTHPRASQYDLLDFIERTWKTRVSRQALSRFLKKYGLDEKSRRQALSAAEAPWAEAAFFEGLVPEDNSDCPASEDEAAPASGTGGSAETGELSHGNAIPSSPQSGFRPIVVHDPAWTGPRIATPPENFFLPEPSMPAASCCCRRR